MLVASGHPNRPPVVLAVDPGCDTGWAIFDAGRLVACGLGDPSRDAPSTIRAALTKLIVERPIIRRFGKKSNPEDIIKLAMKAGEWAGIFRDCEVRYVKPSEWKGTTDKDIHNARTWAKLDGREQDVVDTAFRAAKGRNGLAPSKRHNVIDAIGLGLFEVGR